MSSRVSVIERVAMELRQIDCEDAAEACGGTSSGDAERNWLRCALREDRPTVTGSRGLVRVAVDATELHELIKAAVEYAKPIGYVRDPDGAQQIFAPSDIAMAFAEDRNPYAALRAVVELHAPASPEPTADGLLWFCSSGEVGMLAEGAAVWPCATIRAVAGALGVEMPDE